MRYQIEIIKKNRKWICLYICLGVFCAFLTNFKANFFQKVVDGLADRSISLRLILFYGVILIIEFLANYLDNYPDNKLKFGIYLDFKLLALKKVSHIDYLAYQKLGTGQLVQQIENGAAAGRDILCEFWFRLLRELIPTILFSIYFIIRISIPVTAAILGGYAVVFLTTNLLLKALYRMKEKILTNEEKLNSFLVRGILEVPIFRMARQFSREIEKAKEAEGEIVASKAKIKMIHEAFFTVFALLVAVLDVGVLVYAWNSSTVSVGTAVALLSLLNNAYTPIAIFNVLYVQYKLDKTAFHRYESFLFLKDDPQLEKGRSLETCRGEIKVQNLQFQYGNRQLFDGLSLTIRPGEKVAFVGESGSGKSTLLKLLSGLVKYEAGSLQIDGAELRELCLNDLYGHISYFSQDSLVFDGTLRENIVFDQSVPEQDILSALDKVSLTGLYSTMKDGLNTQLGERGIVLSGGERQRVALARLWFEKREITILDEATSALDNLTEEKVIGEVVRLLQGRTLIAVTHKLNSVIHFDRIVVFRNGKVTGQGTLEELLKTDQYFLDLYQANVQ